MHRYIACINHLLWICISYFEYTYPNDEELITVYDKMAINPSLDAINPFPDPRQGIMLSRS